MAKADASERRGLGVLAGPTIGTLELDQIAERVAAERSAERAAARARLDSAAARVSHDAGTARSQLDHLLTTRQVLHDGADWARRIDGELADRHEAVQRARAALDARVAEQRAARSGLERISEQRSAAGVAMEDAERELSELVGVGMDETALRRELEAAGQGARSAQDAYDLAVARLRDLEAEREELARRSGVLQEVLSGVVGAEGCGDRELQRVRDALGAWVDERRFGELDPDAQALADAFVDLAADLEELQRRTPPRPDDAALERAEADVRHAERVLARCATPVDRSALTPEERGEIDAAHDEVLRTQERLGRRFGAAAARRAHDEAVMVERRLLEHHGFSTYLDVVLSGGRPVNDDPARLAAERAYLAACATLDSLRRAAAPSPDQAHLASEQRRLLDRAAQLLAVDPGGQVIDLLRSHPYLPRAMVDELRDALHEVRVHPVEVGLEAAAHAWLAEADAAAEERRNARAAMGAAADELAALSARSESVAAELAEARQAEASAIEQLERAGRSVGTFEAELSVRAGEDEQRLRRFAAAEQLRNRVEALTTTLARAETDAFAALDRTGTEVVAAEVALDNAEQALTAVAERARALASELPIDRRPAGDPLASLVVLAEALVDHATLLEPEIAAAQTAADRAAARAAEAFAAAEAAGTGLEAPRPEDVREGFERLLRGFPVAPVLLADPFAGVPTPLRAELLELLVQHSDDRSVVLVTDDPVVLGWAIELPSERGSVVPLSALAQLPTPQIVSDPDLDPHATNDHADARRSVGHR